MATTAPHCIIQLLVVRFLLALAFYVGSVAAFSVGSPSSLTQYRQLHRRLNHGVNILHTSSSADLTGADTAANNYNPRENFPDAPIEEFVMLPHRPLGCTVEESLADSNLVIVTKIAEGGFADKAGIKVGDVLVGVTGLFGDMTSAVGIGVEKVKGVVAACPDDEALEIHVARGTNVLEDHEKVLIDLCNSDGEFDNKEIEQCVIDFLSMDSVALDEENRDNQEECDIDEEGNCLVDNLYNMWNDDLPVSYKPSTSDDEEPHEEKPVVKPWSSRSSPSGTYARDPATGEMKRID